MSARPNVFMNMRAGGMLTFTLRTRRCGSILMVSYALASLYRAFNAGLYTRHLVRGYRISQMRQPDVVGRFKLRGLFKTGLDAETALTFGGRCIYLRERSTRVGLLPLTHPVPL